MEKIALVDMDGVLCRWDDTMIPALKSMESPLEKGLYDYSDVWPLQEKYPHIENRANMIMSKQGFWTSLKPYESGLRLYKELTKNFTVYILTKALKNCSLAWKEKVDWLHKYIGDNIHIMVVTDKRLVMGDLLVDDLPKNAEQWLPNNRNGQVIMPLRSYNKHLAISSDWYAKKVSLWDDRPQPIPLPEGSFGDQTYKINFTVPKMVIENILDTKLERGFDLYG